MSSPSHTYTAAEVAEAAPYFLDPEDSSPDLPVVPHPGHPTLEDRVERAKTAGYQFNAFISGNIANIPRTPEITGPGSKNRYHVLIRGKAGCEHLGIYSTLRDLRLHTDSESLTHSFASLAEARAFFHAVFGEEIPWQTFGNAPCQVHDGSR